MMVREVMSRKVGACTPATDLGTTAMIMWRNDCGAVPIVDPHTRHVTGVITDRDICMALATTGRRPEERMAGEVAGPHLHCVRPDDPVGLALEVMRKHQVRRLPVVAEDGTLAGMLSINDLILRADNRGRGTAGLTGQEVLFALKSICRHREHEAEPAHARPLEAVAH